MASNNGEETPNREGPPKEINSKTPSAPDSNADSSDNTRAPAAAVRNEREEELRESRISNSEDPQRHAGFQNPEVLIQDSGNDLLPSPGAGMFAPRRDVGGAGRGSMLVGPRDPRWGRVGVGEVGGPLGRGGGPLPPGIPPGARFDPFGPPGVPGFEPNRFTRDPRRPPPGSHPDLEHFR